MDKSLPDAVDKIAALAKNAAGFSVGSVSVSGLGDGLPSLVPYGFDHREHGAGFYSLKSMIDEYRLYPARRRGTATVLTLQSFVDLVNRHKSEHSVVFAQTSWPNPSLKAVINYHEMVNPAADGDKPSAPPKPAFGDHCVHYPFPVTDEFKEWADNEGDGMSQGEFAAFIEERVAELSQATAQEEKDLVALFGTGKIATPSDMLMLSRGLEVNVAGRVKNSLRLSSGEGELVFTEEHLDGSGNKISVPNLFVICLPVFLDGKAVRLPARLRYRVKDGSVVWSYQLYRWKELVRDRVVEDADFAASCTSLPIYEGSPER